MNGDQTGLTTLTGCIVMFGAWFYIGAKIHKSEAVILRPTRLLHGFFLYLALFFLFMWSPHILLSIQPESFPLYMSWGYIIGHIFLYLGFINIARMTFSVMPRFSSKERYIVIIGYSAAAVITAMNIATMAFGIMPSYDYSQHVTLFNASPLVGASIGILAAISVLPAALLFIINGYKNPNRRIRSYLLGGGLFLLMTAGPVHDIARTGQVYMIADFMSIISILLVGAGVAYRLEQNIAFSKQANITTANA